MKRLICLFKKHDWEYGVNTITFEQERRCKRCGRYEIRVCNYVDTDHWYKPNSWWL